MPSDMALSAKGNSFVVVRSYPHACPGPVMRVAACLAQALMARLLSQPVRVLGVLAGHAMEAIPICAEFLCR
ncbi:MAG: hypothetical protein V3W41_13080 [Planctomycetota bacterium]